MRCPCRNGCGVGRTAGEATLCTLSLGQERINSRDKGVFIGWLAPSQPLQHSPHDAGTDDQTAKDDEAHRPTNPMKASDIKPAVSMASGVPRNARGTRCATNRSRMHVNISSTNVNPSAAPRP